MFISMAIMMMCINGGQVLSSAKTFPNPLLLLKSRTHLTHALTNPKNNGAGLVKVDLNSG